MRAAVIAAAQRLEVVQTDAPVPGPNQVVVSVDGCGICGSDLAVWEGRPWFTYPLRPGRPGHEAWGTVATLGEGVTGLDVGTRVTGLLYNGFAEHDVADADALVALPDAISGPFPGEAIGCALNILDRSGIESGHTVAVVGIGFLGGLLVQLATARGARVIALSRREFARQTALACGATDVRGLDGDPVAEVSALTSGGMCDVAIEATGQQSALDVASELVRVRGRLVIAGFHQDGLRTVNLQSWNWRGIDVVNAHERETSVYVRGIAAAVDAVARGVLDLQPVLTHTFGLDELDVALNLALQRPDGFVKAVVVR